MSEIPIAFWSWKSDAPSQTSVQRAIDRTGARTLFIRAGQIDLQRASVRCIRRIASPFPRGIDLHLVYNATGDLLAEFERIDLDLLALTICESYSADAGRAKGEGAQLVGLQLDIDVPTRLLPKYEQLLRILRQRLPQGTTLSITGLATWMTSAALPAVIDAVDFWAPQFYGAAIPSRLDDKTPISSVGAVSYGVDLARRLRRPFYAGLAAYGYAIHFDRDGRRIQVSASLDPELVAKSDSLELLENGPFDSQASTQGRMQTPSELRYLYRARENCKVGGLLVRAGERVMLDLPTAAVLRANARAVRERAGDRLLGICVFRLPDSSDSTTLTIEEVASALSDMGPTVATDLQARWLGSRGGRRALVELVCTNNGATRGQLESEGLILYVHASGAHAVYRNGFDFSENRRIEGLTPYLTRRSWNPGMTATAILEFTGSPPDALTIQMVLRTNEQHTVSETRYVKIREANSS